MTLTTQQYLYFEVFGHGFILGWCILSCLAVIAAGRRSRISGVQNTAILNGVQNTAKDYINANI